MPSYEDRLKAQQDLIEQAKSRIKEIKSADRKMQRKQTARAKFALAELIIVECGRWPELAKDIRKIVSRSKISDGDRKVIELSLGLPQVANDQELPTGSNSDAA